MLIEKRVMPLCVFIVLLVLFGLKSFYAETIDSSDQVVIKQIYTKLNTVQDTNTTSEFTPYFFGNRIYIEAEMTTTIDITNTRVNYTSLRKLISGWVLTIGSSEHGTQVMSSTIPAEEYDLETAISYVNLDLFLAAQFISENYVTSMVEYIRGRLRGNITDFTLEIEFNGTSFFNKIPVMVFKIKGFMEANSTEFGLIKGSFSGYSYLYIGLPIPVYGILTYNIETRAIGIRYTASSKTIYSLSKHNFENTVLYGYYVVDGLEIVIGGFPRSNITVNIYANQTQLEVINNGTDIGYVLIKSREPVFLNIRGVRIKYTGFKIYGIYSGGSRLVDVNATLSKNTTLNTTQLYYREKSLVTDPFVLTSVIIIVVAIASYIVFKHSKSSKRRI